MYTLRTRSHTLGANLYAQLALINNISASELRRKFIKSALLAGWVFPDKFALPQEILDNICFFFFCLVLLHACMKGITLLVSISSGGGFPSKSEASKQSGIRVARRPTTKNKPCSKP